MPWLCQEEPEACRDRLHPAGRAVGRVQLDHLLGQNKQTFSSQGSIRFSATS